MWPLAYPGCYCGGGVAEPEPRAVVADHQREDGLARVEEDAAAAQRGLCLIRVRQAHTTITSYASKQSATFCTTMQAHLHYRQSQTWEWMQESRHCPHGSSMCLCTQACAGPRAGTCRLQSEKCITLLLHHGSSPEEPERSRLLSSLKRMVLTTS